MQRRDNGRKRSGNVGEGKSSSGCAATAAREDEVVEVTRGLWWQSGGELAAERSWSRLLSVLVVRKRKRGEEGFS